MKRYWSIITVAMMTWIFTMAGRSGAVTCIPVAEQIKRADVIVQAKVMNVSAADQMELLVSRYFKGDGPSSIRAMASGLSTGSRMDWERAPQRGDVVLVGLRQADGMMKNDLCDLMVVLESGKGLPSEVGSLLGEGRVVTQEMASWWNRYRLGLVLLIVFGIGLAFGIYHRARRRTKQT